MRIGIDARLYGLENAGLGRYVTMLVDLLLKIDKKNTYVLFVTSKYAPKFKHKKGVRTVVADIPIYSFREQTILPLKYSREKLDLLHVPHFNAPLLYKGKTIITIHDLIKHESKGKDTTTRSKPLYLLKRLGYLAQTKLIASKATHIIVPTQYVKNDCVKKLAVSPQKISVTYEAPSGTIKDLVLEEKDKILTLQKYNLRQPFVVYTGSVYPHKNVGTLIKAIIAHNQNKEVDLELAIICSRSVFYQRLEEEIKKANQENTIKLLGFLNDDEMSKVYSLSLALVHPSKMEGFGLTGLEAMSVGLPVISSNATCLPEVYGEGALYFDPDSQEELVSALESLIKDQSLRSILAEKGYLQARKYSWNKMAKETLKIYGMV